MSQICPTCGRKLEKRKVTFGKHHLTALIKAYNLACKTKSNTIKIGEMRESKTIDPIEYANMNNLVKFKFFYRKQGFVSGEYGLLFSKIQKFIQNQITIPAFYLVNPVTKEEEYSQDQIGILQVPNIDKIRQELGERFTEYSHNRDAEKIATTQPTLEGMQASAQIPDSW